MSWVGLKNEFSNGIKKKNHSNHHRASRIEKSTTISDRNVCLSFVYCFLFNFIRQNENERNIGFRTLEKSLTINARRIFNDAIFHLTWCSSQFCRYFKFAAFSHVCNNFIAYSMLSAILWHLLCYLFSRWIFRLMKKKLNNSIQFICQFLFVCLCSYQMTA